MWQQLHLYTNQQATEQLCELLTDYGALSVTIQDAADEPIFEPEVDTTPLWSNTHIVALFPKKFDVNQVLSKIKEKHPQEFTHRLESLADQDWARTCLKDFKPMQFGNRLWVCPSWQKPPHADAVNIILDPGLAFGTGTHATTALCLSWLDSLDLKNKTVIDYGCGSGILAIAAARLGAKHVVAIDTDPQALIATKVNSEINQINSHQLTIYKPEELQRRPQHDILIANILARPLIELAATFTKLIKPNGLIGLSGILDEQVAEIWQVYQPHFVVESTTHKEGWALITGRRKTKGLTENTVSKIKSNE